MDNGVTYSNLSSFLRSIGFELSSFSVEPVNIWEKDDIEITITVSGGFVSNHLLDLVLQKANATRQELHSFIQLEK